MTDNSAATVDEAPWPSRRASWTVVAILLVASSLSFLDRQILNLLVEPIREDLKITDTQVSLLQGPAFALMYAAAGIPLGWLADRGSRRIIISVGVAAWSAMTVACGLAQGFWQVFAARMGVGVGEASLAPSGYSLLSDYFPKDSLPFAISVFSTGIYIGGGLALVLGGVALEAASWMVDQGVPIISNSAEWQIAFILVGAPGFLVALLILAIKEPLRRGRMTKTAETASFADLLAFMKLNRATIFAHFAGISLLTLYGFALLAWLPTFFVRVFDLSESFIGLTFGVILIIFGPIGALAGGAYASNLIRKGKTDGAMRVAAMGATALGPVAVATLLAPTPWLCFLLLPATTFLGSLYYGLSPSIVQMIAPNELRGRLSAVMMLTTTVIGMGLGPVSVALLTDYVFQDPQMVRYSLVVIAGLTAPLAALLLWRGCKHLRTSIERAEKYAGVAA